MSGHYRGVATNQGSYKYYFNGVGTKVSGHYREVAMHSSGVAIKRSSTVNGITFFLWSSMTEQYLKCVFNCQFAGCIKAFCDPRGRRSSGG